MLLDEKCIYDILCYDLLEYHLEGAIVEGVSTNHPHDLFLHHGFVGCSGE